VRSSILRRNGGGTLFIAAAAATLATLGTAPIARAAWANVTLGKPVSVVSGSTEVFNPSTSDDVITDGVFVPEDTAYNQTTSTAKQWGTTNGQNDDGTNTDTIFRVDLQGEFTIDSAIVQADDNDSYLLQYHDLNTDTYQTLWNVPSVSVGLGLRTRPNADQTTQMPVGPVITDAIELSAGATGDAGFAVTELQVFGTPVPEPASATLVLASLAIVSLRPRRRSR